MTIRKLEPVVDENSPLGSWGLVADTCPMHPHQDIIGAKHEECMKGIQTNMQGAIPLSTCKHAGKFNHEVREVDCLFTPPVKVAA